MTTESPYSESQAFATRGTGWLPQPPDPRDYPLAQWHPELMASPLKALPRKASLRGRLPIRDQRQTNSCVGFAVTRAFEHALLRLGIAAGSPDWNEFFAYYNARLLMGGNWVNMDQGAYIRDGIKGLAQYGLCKETLHPSYQPLVKPSQQAYSEAFKNKIARYFAVPKDIMQIKTLLAAEIPVVVGFNVYGNYMNQPGGRWPDPVGPIQSGHAVLVEGYNDDHGDPWQVEEAGSWNVNFGDAGYHWMKWDYLIGQGADFWFVEVVEGEPVKPPTPPVPTPTDITKVSDADFEAELVRRWGDLSGIDIRLLFRKGRQWVRGWKD